MSRVRYRKECWFFFQGEKYLGYRFVSGLPEEQINFDDEKVTQIVKGKTTQQEILVMFGEPNGVLRFPATPEPTDPAPTTAGDSLYDYNFRLFTLGGSRFENKDLRVIFDPTGVVKDVRFTANTKGQKFRQGAFTPEL